MIITEWKCVNDKCQRQVGDMVEIFIVQKDDPDTAYIFAYPQLDKRKMPNGDHVLGQSRIIGWPSFWPIFNRRRVYSYSYPVEKTL